MTRTARLRVYAKLNLGLRVLYKRPDGYHELRTVFQTISLHDGLEISFQRGPGTRIVVETDPPIPDNLVEKTARILAQTLNIQGNIVFRLQKTIPIGAGLGGGSSDAAAAILALPVLAGKRSSLAQLRAVAEQLGSDVPFFLYGGTALGIGRGEELYPLPDRPRSRGVLIMPRVHSSTASAYRDLSERLTSIPLQNKLVSFQQEIWQEEKGVGGAGRRDWNNQAANDFEEVVFARYPELARVKKRLRDLGASHSAMTGSGSAIFGLFEDAEKLDRAMKSFPRERVFPISFVSRAQYRSAWIRALTPHVENELWPPQSRYAR